MARGEDTENRSAAPLRDPAGRVADGVTLPVEAGPVAGAPPPIAASFPPILEHVRDIMLLLRRDGRIIDANAAAVAAYGYDRATLRSLGIRDLRAPETVAALAAQMARAEDGGIRFRTRHRRADGTIFPVEVSGAGAEVAGERVIVSVIRDITDRERAEHALAASAARLDLTLEAGGMGAWEVDLATGARSRDARMLALCGLPPDTPFDAGAVFDALVHPEDMALRAEALRRALTGDGEYHCEFRIRRADTGEERWIAARGHALAGPEGQPERLVGVNFDVTERKAAEAALRAGEERLRIALEAGRMAVWERDIVADRIRASPELNRLLGFPEGANPSTEEIRSRYWPGERERVRRLSRAAAESGARFAEMEFRFIRPDESVRWLLLRAEMQRDAAGRAVRTLGIALDVTQRHQAEQALRDSEERLRMAIGAARMATWELDVRGGIATRSGHLVADRPGLPRERFTVAAWIGQAHPEDRDALARAVADAAAGRVERFAVEYRVPRDTADEAPWMWIATHGAVVERDPATGEVLRLAGVGLDITERKEAEERLRLLAREVDHRAKNALTVVQAALRLTPRHDVHAYAEAVEGRVRALARAHGLLAQGRWSGADLRALAEGELSLFLAVKGPDGGGSARPRAELHGPAVRLRPEAVQSISMALHELATNATKHGALSTPRGVVRLDWWLDRQAGALRLRWSERNGPPVPGPPTRRGFGSRVLKATIRDQLGGRVALDWPAEGLACAMEVPLARVLAHGAGARGAARQPPSG